MLLLYFSPYIYILFLNKYSQYTVVSHVFNFTCRYGLADKLKYVQCQLNDMHTVHAK